MTAPALLPAPGFSVHDLMHALLPLTTQRWTDPQVFSQLASAAGFELIEARIFFLTQLKERLRMLPLKLFVSPEARDKLLESLQEAIDQEIAREDGP